MAQGACPRRISCLGPILGRLPNFSELAEPGSLCLDPLNGDPASTDPQLLRRTHRRYRLPIGEAQGNASWMDRSFDSRSKDGMDPLLLRGSG